MATLQFTIASLPTNIFLRDWRNLENVKKTHPDAGRTCKTPERQSPKLKLEPEAKSCEAARLPAAPMCYNRKLFPEIFLIMLFILTLFLFECFTQEVAFLLDFVL